MGGGGESKLAEATNQTGTGHEKEGVETLIEGR
jgi:hypothetical protein